MKIQTGFAGAALAAIFSVSAMAAELPVKAPPVAVALPSWAGFYLGGSVGWARTSVRGDYVTTPTLNHHDATGNGVAAGAHFGLQRQWSQLVLGVEANFIGNFRRATNDGPNDRCLLQLLGTPLSCRGRIDNIITVGPRVGFVPNAQVMFFGTGGFATARLSTSVFNFGTGREIGRSDLRHNGWFAGGGIEYALTRNWIAGVEYQRIQLQTRRHYDEYFGGCCTITAETRDMRGNLDLVRFRLSYRVDWR